MITLRVSFPFFILTTVTLFHVTPGVTYAIRNSIYKCISNRELASLPIRSGHIDSFETLFDNDRNIIAHRNTEKRLCFIQKTATESSSSATKVKSRCLTDTQLWNFAGDMIHDFCRGCRPLLVGSVALLKNRDDVQISSESLEAIVADYSTRVRRNTGQSANAQLSAPPIGRYRGQTQSQYINFNGDATPPGRAEAESTPTGSRAVVSGKSGMGQAQSQSGFSSGCEDCYGPTQLAGGSHVIGDKFKTPSYYGQVGYYPETEVIVPRTDGRSYPGQDDKYRPLSGYPATPGTHTYGVHESGRDDGGRPTQQGRPGKYSQEPGTQFTAGQPGYIDESKQYPKTTYLTYGPSGELIQTPSTRYDGDPSKQFQGGRQQYLPPGHRDGTGTYQPSGTYTEQDWRPTYPGQQLVPGRQEQRPGFDDTFSRQDPKTSGRYAPSTEGGQQFGKPSTEVGQIGGDRNIYTDTGTPGTRLVPGSQINTGLDRISGGQQPTRDGFIQPRPGGYPSGSRQNEIIDGTKMPAGTPGIYKDTQGAGVHQGTHKDEGGYHIQQPGYTTHIGEPGTQDYGTSYIPGGYDDSHEIYRGPPLVHHMVPGTYEGSYLTSPGYPSNTFPSTPGDYQGRQTYYPGPGMLKPGYQQGTEDVYDKSYPSKTDLRPGQSTQQGSGKAYEVTPQGRVDFRPGHPSTVGSQRGTGGDGQGRLDLQPSQIIPGTPQGPRGTNQETYKDSQELQPGQMIPGSVQGPDGSYQVIHQTEPNLQPGQRIPGTPQGPGVTYQGPHQGRPDLQQSQGKPGSIPGSTGTYQVTHQGRPDLQPGQRIPGTQGPEGTFPGFTQGRPDLQQGQGVPSTMQRPGGTYQEFQQGRPDLLPGLRQPGTQGPGGAYTDNQQGRPDQQQGQRIPGTQQGPGGTYLQPGQTIPGEQGPGGTYTDFQKGRPDLQPGQRIPGTPQGPGGTYPDYQQGRPDLQPGQRVPGTPQGSVGTYPDYQQGRPDLQPSQRIPGTPQRTGGTYPDYQQGRPDLQPGQRIPGTPQGPGGTYPDYQQGRPDLQPGQRVPGTPEGSVGTYPDYQQGRPDLQPSQRIPGTPQGTGGTYPVFQQGRPGLQPGQRIPGTPQGPGGTYSDYQQGRPDLQPGQRVPGTPQGPGGTYPDYQQGRPDLQPAQRVPGTPQVPGGTYPDYQQGRPDLQPGQRVQGTPQGPGGTYPDYQQGRPDLLPGQRVPGTPQGSVGTYPDYQQGRPDLQPGQRIPGTPQGTGGTYTDFQQGRSDLQPGQIIPGTLGPGGIHQVTEGRPDLRPSQGTTDTQSRPGYYHTVPGKPDSTYIQVSPGNYQLVPGTQQIPGQVPGAGVSQGVLLRPGAYGETTGQGNLEGKITGPPRGTLDSGFLGPPHSIHDNQQKGQETYYGDPGRYQATPGIYREGAGDPQRLIPGISQYPGTTQPAGEHQRISGTPPGIQQGTGDFIGTQPGTGQQTVHPGIPGIYTDSPGTPGVPYGQGRIPQTYPGTLTQGPGLSQQGTPGNLRQPGGKIDQYYPGSGQYIGGPGSYQKPSGMTQDGREIGGKGSYQISREQDSHSGYPPSVSHVSQEWDGRSPGQTQYSSYKNTDQGGAIITADDVEEAEDADSQAETSIQRLENGTFASSSSTGVYRGGSAHSQISGTYSGSGSFSAQAQTIEANRGAQSQISAGERGVISTAQGRGGKGQSQVQMQLGTDMGETIAEAQSSGINHGTNTQVKASSTGGLADAQATGPGTTSSQAQIGFQPQEENHEVVNGDGPFHGGGAASAQSGKYDGQTQTQIQGRFKYGISYSGAAQAGSGIKDGVPRNRTFMKPLNLFTHNNQRIDREVFTKSQKINKTEEPPKETFEEAESSFHTSIQLPQYNNRSNSANIKPRISTSFVMDQKQSLLPKGDMTDNYDKGLRGIPNEDDYDDGEIDDYDAEFYHSTEASHQELTQPREVVIQQAGRNQKQHIILGSMNENGIHIVKDSTSKDSLKEGMVFQPGEEIPGTQGYIIPIGFRGRVSSISEGEDAYAYADENSESQAQTITLTPGNGNITYSRPTHKNQPSVRKLSPTSGRYNPKINRNNLRSNYNMDDPDSYVTVTKSITGELNQNKTGLVEDKKFTHTYFTKSSTCGYFTFTCNLVYGSNGRTKICKPKAPTLPDGTPINC